MMINKTRLVDSKLVLRKEKLFYCSFIFIIIWELCSFIILSYIGYNFISNAYAVEKYSLEGFVFFVFGIIILNVFPIHMMIMAWPKAIQKKNNKYEVKTFLYSFLVEQENISFLKSFPNDIPLIKTNLGRIKLIERSYDYIGKDDRKNFWSVSK